MKTFRLKMSISTSSSPADPKNYELIIYFPGSKNSLDAMDRKILEDLKSLKSFS